VAKKPGGLLGPAPSSKKSASSLNQFAPLTFIARPSSENLQRRSVFSVTVRLDYDPHILSVRHKESEQAFHGELAKLSAQQNTLRLPDPFSLFWLIAFSPCNASRFPAIPAMQPPIPKPALPHRLATATSNLGDRVLHELAAPIGRDVPAARRALERTGFA
jgi:hypothetical protein